MSSLSGSVLKAPEPKIALSPRRERAPSAKSKAALRAALARTIVLPKIRSGPEIRRRGENHRMIGADARGPILARDVPRRSIQVAPALRLQKGGWRVSIELSRQRKGLISDNVYGGVL